MAVAIITYSFYVIANKDDKKEQYIQSLSVFTSNIGMARMFYTREEAESTVVHELDPKQWWVVAVDFTATIKELK